jgi:hypothetical protein
MKHKLLFKNYLKTFFLLAFFAVGNLTFGQTPNGTLDFGSPTSGVTATTANTGFGGVRVGTGGGGFNIQNPGQSIGVDGELRGIAPTSGSVNSVGVTSAEFGSASATFTVSFDLYLSGGTSGTWNFFAGNGTSFGSAQSGSFTGAQSFTGLRWVFGGSNSISTDNRAAGTWTNISGTPFSQNTAYSVRIIGNNSSSTENYSGGSVAAYTYDLWVNDILVGDDLGKAQLSNATSINAFRFFGESSVSNVAQIALDNVQWYNSCFKPSTPNATWDGTTWSNTTGPDATTQATIAGIYSTATNGTFTAKNVVIQSGSLTVNSGTTLTIQDGIENQLTEAAFVIENNANLIQTNILATNTGNANVKSNSAPMVRLDYTAWSSPVTAQKAKAFSPETLDARFYTYNPISNVYAVVTNPATTNLETGVGYLIRAADNSSPTVASAYNGQFIGVPVNGTKTTPVSIGFNLVGNPYASKLDAQTFLSNANTTALGITTLHFWSNTAAAVGGVYQTNNYASFNAMGGSASASNSEIPNGIIAVGQGFFVNPTSAGNVTFNNNMRTTAASTQFFKTNTTANVPTDKHRFWLNLFTPTTANNQILIGYTTDASNDFDAKYDAPLFGNTASVIYSKVADKKLVIQGRSSFATTDAIPLGIQTTEAGQFTIALADFDGLFLNQDIFLKDNVLNTIQNLKNGSYTFNAAQGEFPSRFEIVFDSSLLSTNSIVFNDASVIVIKNNNGISIETGNNTMAKVAVYDIRGRLLVTKTNINANTAILNNVATSNQVLIVRITNTNNQTVTKKIVN